MVRSMRVPRWSSLILFWTPSRVIVLAVGCGATVPPSSASDGASLAALDAMLAMSKTSGYGAGMSRSYG
jgi:hypothetical protein